MNGLIPITYAKNDHAGFLFDTIICKNRFSGLDKLSKFATMPARRLAFSVAVPFALRRTQSPTFASQTLGL